MKRALVIATLLLSSLPAAAQDSEVNRCLHEAGKLRDQAEFARAVATCIDEEGRRIELELMRRRAQINRCLHEAMKLPQDSAEFVRAVVACMGGEERYRREIEAANRKDIREQDAPACFHPYEPRNAADREWQRLGVSFCPRTSHEAHPGDCRLRPRP
jgi:hypothetical protein